MNPALRSSAAHVFVGSIDSPEISADDAHHLFRVLRLRDGEPVTLSDGGGAWCTAEIDRGTVTKTGDVVHEPAPRPCTIAAAIPKGDRIEWMVQKLTEIGVAEIVLLHCDRSVVRWEGERAGKQITRLGRIAREAAAQSRRVWLPQIVGPLPFAAVASRGGAMIADPSGAPGAVGEVLLIGPEGGFSASELQAPVPRVRLLDTVLRVETAAVVGAAARLWSS